MPVRNLLQLVLLIALVLAPICMRGAAMAMPAAAQAAGHHAAAADQGHCDAMGGQQGDEAQGGGDVDCRTGCTGVLVPTTWFGERLTVAGVPRTMPLLVPPPGRNPAAEPPPPRLS